MSDEEILIPSPDMLNDYGKQLYWIAAGQRDMCGELIRVFERADFKHTKEDQYLHDIVDYIRHRSIEAEKLLARLAKENKKGYKVLK